VIEEEDEMFGLENVMFENLVHYYVERFFHKKAY
jgi:hypothetical protein